MLLFFLRYPQDELNLLFGLNDGTSKQKNKPTIIKFHQYLYVLNWCMQTLLIAKEKKLIIDNFLLYHFNNLLNEFRASTGSLYDKINNPIPYSYYWLIRFLTSIFLVDDDLCQKLIFSTRISDIPLAYFGNLPFSSPCG